MITVIVPARNAASTIDECLQAILHQEGMRFGIDYEVIVVDDGSDDETAEIARRYSVNVIQQTNKGPAAARNAAVKTARGELLAFTDSDCAPSPDWLRKLTGPFENGSVVGVKGAYLTHQQDLVSRFVQLEYEYKEKRMRNLPEIDFIDTFSAAYRKDIFIQNGGFDETFQHPAVEDIEFSFRLARKGYRLIFEPAATVFHQHDRNFSEYIVRKFKIGYWGAYMLRWTAEKFFTDSHTAPTQRLEILLFPVLITSLLLMMIRPYVGSIAFLATLLVFLFATIPFQIFIGKRDPQVLSVATIMLVLRAAALGSGLAKGFLWPPKTKTRDLPYLSIHVRAIKRLADIVGGGIGLLLASPVIAIAALAIRLDSKGPVIFRQIRAGEFGKPFTILKLRTMVDTADQMAPQMQSMNQLKGPAFKVPNDPRITRVGKVLRRWSLDELPQFWNVIRGDMSLVGPRPEVMRLVDQYNDEQRQRLLIKPGLTGPVQVNGRDGLDFDQRFRLEIAYLKSYSLFEDMKILFKTIPAIISGEGII